MRVLMLGWEFPPHISGGVGTACLGLTRALAAMSVDVTFVLPTRPTTADHLPDHLRLLAANEARDSDAVSSVAKTPPVELAEWATQGLAVSEMPGVTLHAVSAAFQHPYPDNGLPPAPPPDGLDAWLNNPLESPLPTPVVLPKDAPSQLAGEPAAEFTTESQDSSPNPYAGDLPAAALDYAHRCVELAAGLEFDVIHAHDWLTFPAAAAVARASGRPWVAHVHSLESDRAGGLHAGDSRIDAVERAGLRVANAVIAVSHRTADKLAHHHGLPDGRVTVVYNGIELFDSASPQPAPQSANPQSLPAHLDAGEKIVLFLGRVTVQKGPEYFLAAARRVLEQFTDVRFVVAGTGDQSAELVQAAKAMGIADRVVFTGFLRGEDVDRIFRMADLYVMPSVS
ncbi:MAG: glycosyltransferase, partial [Algisphaera sp.]